MPINPERLGDGIGSLALRPALEYENRFANVFRVASQETVAVRGSLWSDARGGAQMGAGAWWSALFATRAAPLVLRRAPFLGYLERRLGAERTASLLLAQILRKNVGALHQRLTHRAASGVRSAWQRTLRCRARTCVWHRRLLRRASTVR